MSDEEEHESRCGESFPMCALNPQRSTTTSARCSFPLAIRVQHGARGEDLVCGSAASLLPCHENETLRSRQNQLSASVNLPKHLAGAMLRLSLRRGQSFKSPDWKKKKRRNIELGSGFGRFLAAKIEFSYGAGQTVNLLALGLQWFESTPTQASPRAILQFLKPFGG